MDGYNNRRPARIPSYGSQNEPPAHGRFQPAPVAIGHRPSRRKDSVQHPKPPLTPSASSSMPQPIANPLLPSAPASPPTPAPSPTPHQLSPTTWQLSNLDDAEEPILEEARRAFLRLSASAKEDWLRSLVEICDNQSLSFLHQIVSPKLKKDPFKMLPNELCWKVRSECRSESLIPMDNSLRSYHLLTTRKHLCAHPRSPRGGVRLSATTKPGKFYAKNMLTGGCPMTLWARHLPLMYPLVTCSLVSICDPRHPPEKLITCPQSARLSMEQLSHDLPSLEYRVSLEDRDRQITDRTLNIATW